MDTVMSTAVPSVVALPAPAVYPGPLDFTVTKQDDGSFVAWLNVRDVGLSGATEHDAIRELLNYVAQACAAGCLDHTGEAKPDVQIDRRDAVWPPDGIARAVSFHPQA